jgi:CAAX prenyl protease-like protein
VEIVSATQTPGPRLLSKYPALPYIAPFVVFVAFLALERFVSAGVEALYPPRVIAVLAALIVFSRNVIDFRVKNAVGSTLLGFAIFVIWVGPDVLWPHYRDYWLFTNSITGSVSSSVPAAVRSSWSFIFFRSLGCIVLVPILEELFWRGWLSRWLIDGHDFRRVPLGAYSAASFWIGSVMFASEHGPFWDVGLVAGIAYNWWMCRQKNLADCILAHAVTNGCLSVYVLVTGQWQYWL